jgi:PAS domain S-box-containing protein
VQEYALFQTDTDGLVTSWNPGAERLFGYTTAEMLRQSVARLLTPEDQQARVLTQEIARVLTGEHAEDARWLVRKDGSRFWAQWVTEPVHDETGQLRGVAKVLRDETDRKRAEERQQLLIGELNHRVKNTLATVQAMASQTLRSTADPAEFSSRFQQRLHALSRAHNLLTRSNWEGADAGDIVRAQLELEGDGERATSSGPPAFLDAQSSLALALVLHELGTNARKYGSLSVPEGRLSVNWQVATVDGESRLQLDWSERGGPPVVVPDKRGFGTTLISMSLRSVGGKTSLQFDREGVRCHLELPLGSGPGEGLSRKDIRLT